MKISVWQYYKGFWSFFGLIATIPLVGPLLRLCVPDSSTSARYLFPPLGDMQPLGLTLTIAVLLPITYVVFVCCQRVRKVPRRAFLVLFAGIVLGPVFLIPLYTSFVRLVEIPSANEEVIVSIGYQRTDFSIQTYPEGKWTDWDILRDRGPWEEQIQKLWTVRSIYTVRVLLWVFYSMPLTCLVSIGSLAVYQHVQEKTSR